MMPKRHKSTREAGDEVAYTSELGRSLVTDRILRTFVEEGKVSSLAIVRAPGTETVLELLEDEAVVFVAFFDAGLWILSIGLVAGVLYLYSVELV